MFFSFFQKNNSKNVKKKQTKTATDLLYLHSHENTISPSRSVKSIKKSKTACQSLVADLAVLRSLKNSHRKKPTDKGASLCIIKLFVMVGLSYSEMFSYHSAWSVKSCPQSLRPSMKDLLLSLMPT